jgi:hypothetical protein
VVAANEELSRELRELVKRSGMGVHSWSMDVSRQNASVTVDCELRWRATEREHAQGTEPALIASLRKRPDIERLRWQT